MKTRLLLSIIFVLGLYTVHAQSSEEHPLYWENDFPGGSVQYLYGDRVVLRKAPSSSAEALDTLMIGSEITILEKSDEVIEVNGLECNWYKVRAGKKKGFIAGGLIALDHREMDGVRYMVIRAGGGEYDLKARCRVLRGDGSYYGHETQLNTGTFYVELTNGRGLEGVEHILCINLVAEACGVDGGEVYLFDDGTTLRDGFSVSNVVEGGVFWFGENLFFPDDEDNYVSENTVLYQREYGEYLDEELDMSRSVIHRVVLHWQDGKFTPDISEMEFDEE